jgi:hypothetical protein
LFGDNFIDNKNTTINLEGRVLPLFDTEDTGTFEVINNNTIDNNVNSFTPGTSGSTPSSGHSSLSACSVSSDMSTPPPNPPGTPSTVVVNGRTINVAAMPQTINAVTTPLFWEENRTALLEDKCNDLYDKATKTRSLTLSEEEKLDDTYNIGIQLTQLCNHFIKFDINDVFTIVYPNSIFPDQIHPTMFSDLFVDYLTIQETQVAASNSWYNEHTHDDYQRTNLQLLRK